MLIILYFLSVMVSGGMLFKAAKKDFGYVTVLGALVLGFASIIPVANVAYSLILFAHAYKHDSFLNHRIM